MTGIIAINEAIRSEDQTPIEIAMQIDENGMTTASALYEWLDLDLEYINNRSLALDLKILFKGLWFVLKDHSGE